MLPTIDGTKLPELPWESLTFEEVLDYYDGPRLMLQQADGGDIYLRPGGPTPMSTPTGGSTYAWDRRG